MGRQFGQKRAGGTVESPPANITASLRQTLFGRFAVIWLSVAVVLVLSAGVFVLTHPGKQTSTKADSESQVVLTVSTKQAQLKTIDRHLSVNGSIFAWDPLSIGSEVAQLRVESINVEEGDMVKTGQILATLNSSILKAQLEQQKAHLAADEAALSKAIQPNRIEDLNSWRAALSQAEANLAQEEANLARVKAHAANLQEIAKRYQELGRAGAVSKMDADTKATDAKTSAADVAAAEKRVEAMKYALRQAKERLAMAERGGRQEDILISRATLNETRARIRQLEAQIEQTIIRAPDDGKIVKREVHLGEICSGGKTMFQMVRDGRFELRAQIPEVDLPRLKPGMDVLMSATGDGDQQVIGKIREVSPFVDEKTRLGTARIDIPKDVHFMKPGLFYHADINLGKSEALVVPSRAVLNRNEKDVVFVLQNGHASLRPVAVGEPLGGGLIEIKSGLQAGETVVVSGAGFMKDGDLVRSVPEDSTSLR